MRRLARGIVIAALLLLAGCGKVRPGNYPEPPPQGLQNIPLAPGYVLKIFPDAKTLSDWCNAWGVGTGPSDYNHHLTEACVVPALKTEAVPAQSLVGQGLYNAIRAHENLHTYDVVHGPNGDGWYLGGAIPSGIDPRIASALAALPKTPQYAAAASPTANAAISPSAGQHVPVQQDPVAAALQLAKAQAPQTSDNDNTAAVLNAISRYLGGRINLAPLGRFK